MNRALRPVEILERSAKASAARQQLAEEVAARPRHRADGISSIGKLFLFWKERHTVAPRETIPDAESGRINLCFHRAISG
jgi:RNA-binding protein YhbY